MTQEEKKQEKKIIVDEDWKKEAQREKAMLAAQEEAEKKEAQQEQRPRGPLPKGDFAALVSMLVTQALYAMGMLKVEGQQEHEPDLEIAKYNIDMLEALQEKTRGNLTPEEEKALESMVHQVRMGYVKVAG
jgi:GH24 family phage-related lysozyme (muramidase)